MTDTAPERREVVIGGQALEAELVVPHACRGLVIFAHGSGSSRHSPRNRYVAERLQKLGFATLLMDLLTDAEALDRANVFDIDLLAGRLGDAVSWARADPVLCALPIGLFGASTGAAAALATAALMPEEIAAVVSRGGRPDLAGPALAPVCAPVLLIVGGADITVLDLNREALTRISAPKKLVIILGATHLFEEPGTLDEVVVHAGAWFQTHLALPAQGKRLAGRPCGAA